MYDIRDISWIIERLQNKEVFEIEELLQIQRDRLINELVEEHPLHKSTNLKEADANDEPNERPGPVDKAEQRWCFSNW